jgi:hypothetical protein
MRTDPAKDHVRKTNEVYSTEDCSGNLTEMTDICFIEVERESQGETDTNVLGDLSTLSDPAIVQQIVDMYARSLPLRICVIDGFTAFAK